MAGCGCRGGGTATSCLCVLRSDGLTSTITGNGNPGSPYVIGLRNTYELGGPSNMVMSLTAPRPNRPQVWWYSTTGARPTNFNAATDILMGPGGFVDTQVPAVVTGLVFTEITGSTFRLSWAPAARADFYRVVGVAPFGGSTGWNVTTTATSMSFGPASVEVYDFTVTAVNEVGDGPTSAVARVTLDNQGDFADSDYSTTDYD